MAIEDPNNNHQQEMAVFDERRAGITEKLAGIEHLAESQGLSSEFIHNVVGNLLAPISMALEMLKEEPDIETRAIVEENLGLAERYLDTLSKNREALRTEASMSLETWSKMGQQESKHAREIIAKYTV